MNVETKGQQYDKLVDNIGSILNRLCQVHLIQISNIIDENYVDVSVGLFNDEQAYMFLSGRK